MTKLNGEGKIIVQLLTAKMDESNQQITKRIDDLIVYNKETADGHKELLHSHCERLRQCEEENVEMRPVKKFYSKLRDYALGLIIFLGGTVILAASYIRHHLTSN